MYSDTLLYINGVWRSGQAGETIDVVNPATGEVIGKLAKANTTDLDEALSAAAEAFKRWSATSAYDRCKMIHKAADLLRARASTIARTMTQEQGKPLAQAEIEMNGAADALDWLAEEGRRAYGRVIPARLPDVQQLVIQEPVGVVAAFTPWNFPINQIARKLGAALAAGCSIIVKGPEETPGSPAELIRCFEDAGVPAGVINLVYGSPAEISEHLIPHPAVRKISFTGSVPVGKQLAALAGLHMKRTTMELGGHAPVIVCNDADIASASKAMLPAKFRNAGQICIAPTRFLVQSRVYDEFVSEFVAGAKSLNVGNGLEEGVTMGPLVTERRLQAVQDLVADATRHGAKVETGGSRIGNKGSFYQPTVLSNLTTEMRVMNEEPFGPLALMIPFDRIEDAVEEANRLPFGLAAYAFTRSAHNAATLSRAVESGMLSINHAGLALPETPFGGIRDSGYGSEGGTEALEAYLNPKFVTHLRLADA